MQHRTLIRWQLISINISCLYQRKIARSYIKWYTCFMKFSKQNYLKKICGKTAVTGIIPSMPMTEREFDNNLNKYLIIYLIIGTIMMICSFIQTMCWEYVSEHQVHSMRKLYFSEITRQDISWYDTNDNGNLPNKLSEWMIWRHWSIGIIRRHNIL
ncbi:uncharacterized protein LOC135847515 [Planococcus citri]|uniref:uncharacterized protein LOC135847515 n=1 Tax=Planococcus citri TaxID=170843 RepID=UPI0031F73E28